MTEAAIGRETRRLRAAAAAGAPIDVRTESGVQLYVDRPLPFVCLYRHADGEAAPAAARLVTSQASYLVVPDGDAHRDDTRTLLTALAEEMTARFGGFLVVEIWEQEMPREDHDPYDLHAAFQVYAADQPEIEPTVAEFALALQRVMIHRFVSQVTTCCTPQPSPPSLEFVCPAVDDVFAVGVAVDPVYRDRTDGGVYPFLFDSLRRQLSDALRKGCFAFSESRTRFDVPVHAALGRRLLEKAVLEVDRGLSDIDESFEFLLQATPVNAEEGWTSFQEGGFEVDPVFRYRPLNIDPELLKRRLYALPVEGVEDPSLSWIFREKQEELDRKITMLRDRGTRQFFFESLQLYGEVDQGLLEEARRLLEELPSTDYDFGSAEHLDAEAFSELASSEFTHYRHSCPDFPETVHIRHDLPPGLMVSRGRLLIGHETKVPAPRVEALLHHEVGTHMLTYFNGREQPLRLLCNGLAGYEALQEGIAVLAEYLVGGLNVPRLRVLAARVVAAHSIVEGASFVDLFRLLRLEYGFEEREAFSICLRTFRGGGLIKDVIYLRGLHELMLYLAGGGLLDPLFVGKIALHHLPVLEELHYRGVSKDPPLTPRYLLDADARKRLDRIRQGGGLLDLIHY